MLRRFPGSRDPGPIEATLANQYTGAFPGKFPGSRDPGPIEARCRLLACASRFAFPGSRDPGPIEAR